MGEAKRRMERDAETITFDFAAPGHAVSAQMKGDPKLKTKEQARVFATCVTISQAVEGKYKGQMKRHDSKLWAPWQEVFDEVQEEGASSKVDMPRSQLEWVYGIIADAEIMMPPGLAQWREALAIYIETLRNQPPLSIVKE